MSFIDSLLAVLVLIVFVAVIAIVIALVIDLFLAIVSPDTRGIFFRRGHTQTKKDEDKRPTVKEASEEQASNTVSLEEYDEQKKEENKVNNWDEALVASEQQKLLSESQESSEANKEQDIATRQQEMEDFDALFENDDESDAEIETLIKEINDYAVEQFNAEQNAPAEVAKEEVKEEQSQAAAAEKVEVVEPVEKAEEVRIEEENVVIPASIYSTLTIDQLNARLEKLKARLKVNEKELKANRKEYMPLARVKKTLERDEQKLRRREAIVARKKVILYGVNNYVDIDEEKAKKLSEDLDLLDGLRLSVQHCEDVMATNKDRFPLLETTNQILVQVNRDLKDDIAEVQDAIQAYKQANPEE